MQVPAAFDYAKATSIDQALSLLAEHGEEARVIAGGHSLLPMMKLRLAKPDALIDINGIAELGTIRVDGDMLSVGALARHADVLRSAIIGEHFPLLHDAERVIADPVVRNWGTVGGSLCQADPAEDLPAALVALRASAVIRSLGGSRTVAIREFHVGPYETVVGPGEILTEVRIDPTRRSMPREARPATLGWRRPAPPWADERRVRWASTMSDRHHGGRRRALHGARGRGVPAGPAGGRGEHRGGRAHRRRTHQPGRRPARPGGLQAPPGSRADRAGTAPCDPSGTGWGGLSMQITVKVNGETYTRDVEPRLLLVHFLRDELG
jgi:hypothetical protein